MQYYFSPWMNYSPSTLSPLRFERLSDKVSPASENSRSDDVLAAGTASMRQVWPLGSLIVLPVGNMRDVAVVGSHTKNS